MGQQRKSNTGYRAQMAQPITCAAKVSQPNQNIDRHETGAVDLVDHVSKFQVVGRTDGGREYVTGRAGKWKLPLSGVGP